LERLKLLQGDPLINEFDILVKEPETVSRFLGNLKQVNIPNVQRDQFQSLQKLLSKNNKLTYITIDIDSSVITR
jgi:hydrogenase maturation factor HypF (carbamoyltransferase family)